MKNKYFEIFYNDILKNKKIFISTVLVGVLCFGFAVTHYSIGIDDTAFEHYFGTFGIGNLIQQGRLLHIIIYKLTGVGDFLPFFNDFVGAVLFCLSALLFCALFRFIAKDKINDYALLSFCVVYVSYSIIFHKFTFNLDVIPTMLSYCSCALSLAYSYLFIENNKKTDFLLSVICLIVAIASYETFIFLYISGVFTILILKMISSDSKVSAKKYFSNGFKCMLILIVSAILYYGTVIIVQLVTEQYGIFVRENIMSGLGFIEIIKSIYSTVQYDLSILLFENYLPFREYLIFSVVGALICILYSVKKKQPLIIISYVFVMISNIAISFVFGGIPKRATQTFSLLVGFVVMLIANSMSKQNFTKRIATLAVVFLVFIQAADMNVNFYNDYKRFKKDEAVVSAIAVDLLKYDVDKSIVFVGDKEIEELNSNDNTHKGIVSLSTVNCSLFAFDSFYKDAPEDALIERPYEVKLFNMLGYDYVKVPTRQQAVDGIEHSKDMNAFPNDGYIKEFDDYIVVKMS